MKPIRGRTASFSTSVTAGSPIVASDPPPLADVVKAIIQEDSSDACERLMSVLDVRDEHGTSWLTHAADHLQALRAALDALLGSALAPVSKLRMMIRVLRHMSPEPHHRAALRMAVMLALDQTQDGHYNDYVEQLQPLLTYFSRRSLSATAPWARQPLPAEEVSDLRSALIALETHGGPGALTDLLQRDSERRTLLHQALANGRTAELGLNIVYLLLWHPEVEPERIQLLGRLLGNRSGDGCTPLWSADFSDRDVRRFVQTALVLIIDADQLSVQTRCTLLLRFSSPPPRPGRAAWDQVVWWVAQAFENCETSKHRDTLNLRRHVQAQFRCWATRQDRTAVRKRISAVVAEHAVALPRSRLMRPPPLPWIDVASRPDGNGRPLLWRAWEENTIDEAVTFVVDLMGEDEADISRADKFRVLVALLSPGTAYWPTNPVPAVQAILWDALRVRIDTPEASLFSDELSELAALMLPNRDADRTAFAKSLEAPDPEDALGIVGKLLQHRYIHVPRYLHRLDRQGQTLIHLAIRHDRDDVLEQLFTGLAAHPLPRSHKRRVLHDLLFTKNREGFNVLSHARLLHKTRMACRLKDLLRDSPILDARQKERWLRKMEGATGPP